MDTAIIRAIEQCWHKTSNEKLKNQDWSLFEKSIVGKKLYLFGLGNGARFFYSEYRTKYDIEGIIDNDTSKQGILVDDLLEYWSDKKVNHVKIYGISELKGYSDGEVVVLITSLKYYEEIAWQLEEEGITEYFALLPLLMRKPIEEKKIVFYSMGRYTDHGKAITEKLLKLRTDLDIVWVVNDLSTEVPSGVRLVSRKNRRKYIYEMTTAKMWMDDYILPEYLDKRSEQIYIQIKHWPSITLKTFGIVLSSFQKREKYVRLCRRSAEMMDYVFVGSDFDERTCREGFPAEWEAVRVGSPRTDVMFDQEECRTKVCSRYGLDPEHKFLVFAPTFRTEKDAEGNFYDVEDYITDLNFKRLHETIQEQFEGKWHILLRRHPNVAQKRPHIDIPEEVIDVSDYGDAQTLLASADMLITDYSNVMFEAAFIKTPVLLYAPDRDKYIGGERELLIDYDSLPFLIANSDDELMENLKRFDKSQYDNIVQDYMDANGVHEDGHASERAAVFISNKLCI